MLKKINAAWDVLQTGKQVANPKLWRTGQISVSLLAGFIAACVHAIEIFWPELGLSVTSEQVDLIAGAFVTIWNIVLTLATDKDIGVRPAPPAPIEEKSFNGPPDDIYRG